MSTSPSFNWNCQPQYWLGCLELFSLLFCVLTQSCRSQFKNHCCYCCQYCQKLIRFCHDFLRTRACVCVFACVCANERFGRNIDELSRNSTKMRNNAAKLDTAAIFVFLVLFSLFWFDCAAWPKNQQQQHNMDEIEYRRQTKRACNFCATNKMAHENNGHYANWLSSVCAAALWTICRRCWWTPKCWCSFIISRNARTHRCACRIRKFAWFSAPSQMNIELHFCIGRIR